MQTCIVRKPTVHSRHGLVAEQNRHAAEAGAAVLARGGNAMDAAVVTALVLSVVEPWLSGIGGGGFLLHGEGTCEGRAHTRFQRADTRRTQPCRLSIGQDRRQLVQLARG